MCVADLLSRLIALELSKCIKAISVTTYVCKLQNCFSFEKCCNVEYERWFFFFFLIQTGFSVSICNVLLFFAKFQSESISQQSKICTVSIIIIIILVTHLVSNLRKFDITAFFQMLYFLCLPPPQLVSLKEKKKFKHLYAGSNFYC